MVKETLGAASVAIGVIAYGIYIGQMLHNRAIQPHPFSWLLWAFVTGVAGLAQWEKGAGAGTWVTAFTAGACFVIAIVTLLMHKWPFSRFDWISLATGFVVLIFHTLASNATASAVFATGADLLGYNSTVRKGWHQPQSDSAWSFALNSAKFVPAIFALDRYSVATLLYPATLVLVNAGVAIMLTLRSRQPHADIA